VCSFRPADFHFFLGKIIDSPRRNSLSLSLSLSLFRKFVSRLDLAALQRVNGAALAQRWENSTRDSIDSIASPLYSPPSPPPAPSRKKKKKKQRKRKKNGSLIESDVASTGYEIRGTSSSLTPSSNTRFLPFPVSSDPKKVLRSPAPPPSPSAAKSFPEAQVFSRFSPARGDQRCPSGPSKIFRAAGHGGGPVDAKNLLESLPTKLGRKDRHFLTTASPASPYPRQGRGGNRGEETRYQLVAVGISSAA